MKWIRKAIAGVACALIIASSVWAADDTDITTSQITGQHGSFWKDIEWFDNFDVGGVVGSQTWYVYNEQSGSATSDGKVEARNYTEDRTIQVHISRIGSSNIGVTIEGRAGTGTAWAELWSRVFTAASDTAFMVNIVEHVEEIRAGVRASGDAGSDSVTITGILRGEEK